MSFLVLLSCWVSGTSCVIKWAKGFRHKFWFLCFWVWHPQPFSIQNTCFHCEAEELWPHMDGCKHSNCGDVDHSVGITGTLWLTSLAGEKEVRERQADRGRFFSYVKQISGSEYRDLGRWKPQHSHHLHALRRVPVFLLTRLFSLREEEGLPRSQALKQRRSHYHHHHCKLWCLSYYHHHHLHPQRKL